MKSSARTSVFMLLLALGSLAIVVAGHAIEQAKSVGEDKAAAAGLTQPEIDPITICSPSNFCIPQPWSECYRCIVKPYDNPPFLTLDECKSNCPIPPAHA
ncbi:hypothetical protein E2562_008157 [Oryza meyeriana var. granulata]|uniref:Bowman-Birk serine protease inhibitors family domain-containing protein n=1 Tax=Oryza meyeriana var. granulata TaxID=110450 RepID=A0A6G1CEJ8_9ORYZ|nr:hypothetical protein E2562_008157 [Oryza meyeriana var. granulata]